jgi:predicted transcriptional regulator
MAKVNKLRRKARVDWERGDMMLRAGQLSVNEVAKCLGCTEGAVRKRMKTRGIARDLTKEVRKQVRISLLSTIGGKVDETKAVQNAAAIGADVIRSHRKDIQNLQRVEQALLAELSDPIKPPQKTYITQNRGEIIQREYDIAVTERAGALHALAAVTQRRITLERQAFNLDETDSGNAEFPQVIERVIVRPGDVDG